MRFADFDFDLPDEQIAQAPLRERRASRLLVLGRDDAAAHHERFASFPDRLAAGDLLVVNDTRVIRARLAARKETGGRAEVLVERVLGPRRCLAYVRSSKSPRAGTRLRVGPEAAFRVEGREGDLFALALESGDDLEALLAREGTVPLPPYIRRAASREDAERYQTVFAAKDGAVAAPTAGLHLDRAMLDALGQRGVEIATLTLHVGAGTFAPPRCERAEDHVMHAERVTVDAALCDAVERTRARGGRVVAVGTTCVRALESAARSGSLCPLDGETRLFITPGFEFRCVDRLLTNFHLPRSTLLMLVCAFAGTRRVLAAYREAVAAGYRFFSYGDACFLDRAPDRT